MGYFNFSEGCEDWDGLFSYLSRASSLTETEKPFVGFLNNSSISRLVCIIEWTPLVVWKTLETMSSASSASFGILGSSGGEEPPSKMNLGRGGYGGGEGAKDLRFNDFGIRITKHSHYIRFPYQ